MDTQCNFCGSLEDITTCPHCISGRAIGAVPVAICLRCYVGHKDTCEYLAKRRKAGAGQTARRINEAPATELFADTFANLPKSMTPEGIKEMAKEMVSREAPPLEAVARAIEVDPGYVVLASGEKISISAIREAAKQQGPLPTHLVEESDEGYKE